MSKNAFPCWQLSILWLIVMMTSGCSSAVKPEQLSHNNLVVLSNGENIGQTFLARFDGLNGVEIYITPEIPTMGELTLHLYPSPKDTSIELASNSLPVREIVAQGFYRIPIPDQSDSANQDYYLQLEAEGQSNIKIGTGAGDAYTNGAFYQNGSPQDAQLTFRLSYNPIQLFTGLFIDGLNWLAILLAGLWLYILPGWAALSLAIPRWISLRWIEKLGLSAGVSLAVYPILFLWTDLFSLHLGSLYAWLPPLVGLIVIIWHNRIKVTSLFMAGSRRRRISDYWYSFVNGLKSPSTWLPYASLVFILLLIFTSRFWVIRNLDAPMWGDSYQHTMIAQLLVDNKGLFESWEPYVPYTSLTLHYGFHTAVAILSWLTNANVVKATMQAGQLLNWLAIITLIPLAIRFSSRNRWAGIGVVIVAGLLLPMPAYYVNWGRYAQLAGQVILPVCLWLLWEIVEELQKTKINDVLNKVNITTGIFLTGIVLAGMLLSYYRMVFYFASFTVAWLLIWGGVRWRQKGISWFKVFAILSSVAVVSLLFILPWFPRLTGSNLSSAIGAGVTSGSSVRAVFANYQIWREVANYIPFILLVISAVALIWGAIRNNWIIFILPLWFILLTAYYAGQVFRLPGANMLQNFAIIISLYIPIGLLVGWLVDDVSGLTEKQSGIFGGYLIAIFTLALAILGAMNIRTVSNPDKFALVTRPDIRAMNWIRLNTPEESRFLVEGFRIYSGSSAVGSDAGWWISLLANRENSMPPQYALMNENPSPSDYSQTVVELVAALEKVSPASQEGIRQLCDKRITHIYIGQGQGNIGAGVTQLFTPERLAESPSFDLVYRQDRVYIFALNQEECGGNL